MDYMSELNKALQKWSEDPIVDEWVFEKFRERLADELKPTDAFEAIGPSVKTLIAERDESNAIELIETILTLARVSNTTESHNVLSSSWLCLRDRFMQFGDYAQMKFKELKEYYRIND